MLLTPDRIDELYQVYLDQYEKSKRYINRLGGTVRQVKETVADIDDNGELTLRTVERDIKPSNKNDFVTDLISKEADLPGYVSPSKIAKSLATDEVYPITQEQAKLAEQAHIDYFGGKSNLSRIMQYRAQAFKEGDERDNIWDIVRQKHKEKEGEGKSTYTAKLEIGEELFGSE